MASPFVPRWRIKNLEILREGCCGVRSLQARGPVIAQHHAFTRSEYQIEPGGAYTISNIGVRPPLIGLLPLPSHTIHNARSFRGDNVLRPQVSGVGHVPAPTATPTSHVTSRKRDLHASRPLPNTAILQTCTRTSYIYGSAIYTISRFHLWKLAVLGETCTNV